MFNKRFITTFAVILVSLLLFALFPANGSFQLFIKSLVFLLVIPVLYIKIILKEDLKDFGVRKGKWEAGIFFAILSIIAALLIFYLLSHYTNFSKEYIKTLPRSAVASFLYFIIYEALVVGFFAALYEFFYRGFVMLGTFSKIGHWGILVQLGLFAGFLWITGNFTWAFTPYLIVAPLAGLTAFRSRSLIYSLAMSWISIIIIDALVISAMK